MQLNTYLSFNGDCKQAFETYQKILGGKIHALMPFADNPGCEHLSDAERGKIMHGCYELDGFMLMGTDATQACPYEGVKGAHVTLSLNDPEDAARIFKALAEGGTIEMPLQETFWALAYGILTDRFGVPWMLNCVQAMGCVEGQEHGQAAA